MNRYLEKVKRILKDEKKKNISIVLFFIFVYMVVGFIFKAGYDMRYLENIEDEVKEKKLVEYDYRLIVDGVKYNLKTNELKPMKEVVLGVEEVDLEFLNYLKGVKLVSVNDKENFEILVNGEKFEGEFLDEIQKLADESVVTINTR